MPNTIVGTIADIGAVQQVPTKNGHVFLKRTVVLDASTFDQFTGDKRENYPSITFVQKHCEDLNNFRQGQRVVVSFIVQGRPYEKDGQKKFFNDVVGYRIEPFATNQQQSIQVQQASQYDAPYQQPMQASQASQNVSNAAQSGNNPATPPMQANTDDLPF